ncbi:MAG: hypothetical protein BWY19_00022 [bacterium ADurb.Bin212]|nr:MAG: hypothetical protein BWY19_00022 [bacterium ADurb.Bin212]
MSEEEKKEGIGGIPTELLPYDAGNDDLVMGRQEIMLGEERACVLDAYTKAGKPNRPNEDAYAIVQSGAQKELLTAGVFDGISSVVDLPDLKGVKGARFASHFIRMRFLELAGNPDIGLKDLMIELNRLLGEANSQLEGADFDKPSTVPSTTATMVRVNTVENKIEIADCADSICLVFYKDGSSKVLSFDTNLFHMDGGLKKIRPEEYKQAKDEGRNVAWGFDNKNNPKDGTYGTGALNGSEMFERYIMSDQIDLDGVEAIFMSSDGMLPPDLSQYAPEDRRQMLQILREGGCAALKERVNQAFESGDQSKWTRPSSPDDATGVFIDLKQVTE